VTDIIIEKETEKETVHEGMMGGNDSVGEMVNRIYIYG